MTYGHCTRILLLAGVLGLAACGGGSHVSSTPTPTAPPPPPPPPPSPPPPPTTTAIIENATASQEFAVKGATGVSIAEADQLRIRYDAVANVYEVQVPASATWERLSLSPNAPGTTTFFQTGSGMDFVVQQGIANGYGYSALAYWTLGANKGAVAFGIPTPREACR